MKNLSKWYKTKRVLSILVLIALLCMPIQHIVYADNQTADTQTTSDGTSDGETGGSDNPDENKPDDNGDKGTGNGDVGTKPDSDGGQKDDDQKKNPDGNPDVIPNTDPNADPNEDPNADLDAAKKTKKVDDPVLETAKTELTITKAQFGNDNPEFIQGACVLEIEISAKDYYESNPAVLNLEIEDRGKEKSGNLELYRGKSIIWENQTYIEKQNSQGEKVKVFSGTAKMSLEFSNESRYWYVSKVLVDYKDANNKDQKAEKQIGALISTDDPNDPNLDNAFDFEVCSESNDSFSNDGKDDSLGNKDKWYSKKVCNPSENQKDLRIHALATDYAQYSEFEMRETTPGVSSKDKIKPEKIKNPRSFSDGLKFKYDIEFAVPSDVEGVHEYTYSYKICSGDVKTQKVYTYIDNTDPSLDIHYEADGAHVSPAGADSSFYNSSLTVVARATDIHFNADNAMNDLRIIENGTDSVDFKFDNWELIDSQLGIYESRVQISSDGIYKVEGKVKDFAGNESEEYEGNEFSIDTTPPEVDLQMENMNVVNGKYYKDPRVAVITVTEKNFDPNAVNKIINSRVGNPTDNGWKPVGADKHQLRIEFNEDGVYSLEFSCKDKAGNQSKTVKEDEFVIDRTAPKLRVSFDNNSAKNDIYYKENRTASVSIDDFSFDESGVMISKSDDEGLSNVPAKSAYSNDGDIHTTKIVFGEDGRYGFKIKCKDMAGNESTEYVCPTFVIDKTAPQITFSGVENYSANNGKVTPSVVMNEKNVDVNGVKVVYSGANNGVVNVACTTTTNSEGATINFSDIDRAKANDDLYTVSAEVTDLAGNVANEELIFSVNRFGSVFVLSDATKSIVDGYYLTSPQDIVISEINVDDLVEREISVTSDGKVNNIKSGRDYKVSAQGSDRGWKSFTYTINKKNFKKDGIYSVNVYTKDRATNEQDSQSRDAKIKFAMDATEPSIVVAGVSQGCVLEENSCDVSVNVSDNMALEDMKIYLNGEEVESFNSKDLQSNGGTTQLTIDESTKEQKLVIVSHDVAGNESKKSIDNILICQKATTVLADNNAPIAGPKILFTKLFGKYENYMLYILGAVAMLVILGEAVFIYKKSSSRKKK